MKSFVIVAASLLASSASFASENNYAFPKDCESLAWETAKSVADVEDFATLEVDGDLAATVRASDVELVSMTFELFEGQCRLVSLEKSFR